MTGYQAPVPLTAVHRTAEFACASVEQTRWLREHAAQAQAAGSVRVFVVTEVDSEIVVAYYAWCMASLEPAHAPARLRKGGGRYQPVALLARLGVDARHERRGLGAGLLREVMVRVALLSEQVGCRALLVHAENESAREFYLNLIPQFEPSPTDELHLVLLTKDIRRTLRAD